MKRNTLAFTLYTAKRRERGDARLARLVGGGGPLNQVLRAHKSQLHFIDDDEGVAVAIFRDKTCDGRRRSLLAMSNFTLSAGRG